ncbi:hypothetical protein ACFO6R_12665 [Eubacterium multiforme]|uniref:Uncharacterized protein n=1 Tax=Eubacterium multiforme TaxID=83339 RepID=A0ABT9UWD9_9FIRM|nr:hypothetical protein [Eubacterium multiforme]MDQ0150579.1 hypothetical protein [Eubacterium multiforme]
MDIIKFDVISKDMAEIVVNINSKEFIGIYKILNNDVNIEGYELSQDNKLILVEMCKEKFRKYENNITN